MCGFFRRSGHGLVSALTACVIFALVSLQPCSGGDLIDRGGPIDLPATGTVRVADLDADGFPDIVVGHGVIRFESVKSFLRTGDRVYSAPLSTDLSYSADDFVLADIDGDGFPDLMGIASGSLYLARGQGDGTFAEAHWSISTPSSSRSAVTGDFDGDRRVDLVVSYYDGSILLFLNDGAGAFQAAQLVEVADRIPYLGAADFDNDRKLDLFVRWPGHSAVLYGSGNGTFSTVDLSDGFTMQFAELIDWNGDGNMDVVYSSYGNSFTLLLGDGRRGFSSGPSGSSPSTRGIGAGDFNGDERADLILLDDTGALFLGRDDGEIVLTREIDERSVEPGFSRLVADLDLDGRDDWILHVQSQRLRIIFGDRGRGLNDVTGQFPRDWKQPIVPGDLNGDGIDDLVRGDHVLFGTPEGNLVQGPKHQEFTPRRIVDLNRDGIPDVLATKHAALVEAYLNDGAGNLTRTWSFLLDEADKLHIGHVDDLVDDNRDLVVLDRGAGVSVPFLSNGDGSFNEGVSVDVGDAPTSQTMGDFDEDGHLDIVVSRPGFIRILFGDGHAAFPTFIDIPEAADIGTLAKPDVNGDGHLDLLHTSETAFHVRLGNGDGTFATPWSYDFGTELGALRLRDIDADGYVDLAATTFETLWIFPGNGVGFDAPRLTWIGHSDDRPGHEVLPQLAVMSLLDAPVLDVAIAIRGHWALGGGVFLYSSRVYDPVACGDGNVNRAAGLRADVLLVNDSTGDGPERAVTVPLTAPVEIRMEAPPSTWLNGVTAKAVAPFVLYASTVTPSRGTVRPLSIAASSLCFPSPITDPATSNITRIWNNLGDEAQFGTPTDPSLPAPSIVDSTHGPNVPGLVGTPMLVFLQGLIRDSGSPSGDLAVTNGVTLRVE